MLFHRNDSIPKIIDIWLTQFKSAAVEKKLLFIYVANEVIQQSAKKGKYDFVRAFGDIFIECFTEMM